jgi:hypothetical protein
LHKCNVYRYAETNTRYLREEKGWRGLLMDGGHENPSINLHRELIYPAKIVQLFEKYEVGGCTR